MRRLARVTGGRSRFAGRTDHQGQTAHQDQKVQEKQLSPVSIDHLRLLESREETDILHSGHDLKREAHAVCVIGHDRHQHTADQRPQLVQTAPQQGPALCGAEHHHNAADNRHIAQPAPHHDTGPADQRA